MDIQVTELKLLAAILAGAKLTWDDQHKQWGFSSKEGNEFSTISLYNVAWHCMEKGYLSPNGDSFGVSEEGKSMLRHMLIDSVFTTL